MSTETTTIARPYAKAVFEYAVDDSSLQNWSDMLSLMATISLDPHAINFITSPDVTTEQQAQFLLEVCGDKLNDKGKNFIHLLAHNKRLLALPEIKALFEVERAEFEKTLAVNVISFSELSDAQQEKLSESLSKRFKRQVSIDVEIDKSLLGGAIIRAGDVVIDASVRGKLNNLSTELAA